MNAVATIRQRQISGYRSHKLCCYWFGGCSNGCRQRPSPAISGIYELLRANAAGLNIQVAPARLEHLRSRVNLERNKFLFWLVFWLLIAMVSLGSNSDAAGRAVQPDVAAGDGHLRGEIPRRVVVNPEAGAVAFAICSWLLFVFAVTVAYIPIIANSDSLNDLESAHAMLKDIED